MGTITQLCIEADFGRRTIHVGQGEWQVVPRNAGNRWVFPLAQTARGYTKLEVYVAQVGNCDLKVLATRGDFADIWEFQLQNMKEAK